MSGSFIKIDLHLKSALRTSYPQGKGLPVDNLCSLLGLSELNALLLIPSHWNLTCMLLTEISIREVIWHAVARKNIAANKNAKPNTLRKVTKTEVTQKSKPKEKPGRP